MIKKILSELVARKLFFTPFGKEWNGLQATLAHMKIDIQHASWIFISMDVFLGFIIQRYSITYVLKLWYVPIFSSSWILYCMHLKLKPLSIDLHATRPPNCKQPILAMSPWWHGFWIMMANLDCKTPFHILATRLLHFWAKCEHFYHLHKIAPLQINLICKKVIPRMHITIDCEIQAIAFTMKQITH